MGEVFYRREGSRSIKVMFNEGHTNPFRFGNVNLNTCWEEYDSFLKECAWYENITEPVICWVWDYYKGGEMLMLVYSYNPSESYPFATKYNEFINARPVTPDELLQQ